MKIREKQEVGAVPGHRLPAGVHSRVRSLADNEPLPKDAESVPDDTPESDWALEPETNQSKPEKAAKGAK